MPGDSSLPTGTGRIWPTGCRRWMRRSASAPLPSSWWRTAFRACSSRTGHCGRESEKTSRIGSPRSGAPSSLPSRTPARRCFRSRRARSARHRPALAVPCTGGRQQRRPLWLAGARPAHGHGLGRGMRGGRRTWAHQCRQRRGRLGHRLASAAGVRCGAAPPDAGIDDAAFCHRVTAALSSGGALYGEPSLTYDPARGTVICGQAIVRTIESTMYNKTLDLSVL